LPVDLHRRPFSLAAARSQGITEAMLRGPRFRTLFAGVYVRADVSMTLPLWLAGARIVLPHDAVVTGLSGLRLLGIAVGPRWPLQFVSASGRRVRRDRVELIRVAALPACRGGIATAEECFVEACKKLDLVDAVTVGDQLVHLGHATRASLAGAVAGRRARGIRTARHAVALVRERSESARETHVRLMIVLAGLPEPSCNVNVGTDDDFVGRGDLVYGAYRLVIEYDGRHHVDVQQQWEQDLDRHDAFAASQWQVLRVTKQRLRQPRTVVRRVHERLVAGGYRGPAPRFDDTWVRLFERTSAARRAATALEGTWH